jgi:hypothetical protein
MGTSLEIDDSVLEAIQELARKQRRSEGDVASDLIRLALTHPASSGAPESLTRFGFRPFPLAVSARRATNRQVKRLRDDLSI